MKLFKSLLVAPAALGLLAPVSVNASEVNLNDISNYSDDIEINSNSFNSKTTTSPLLAGGEGLVDSHDGGFSQTTTASFSADMMLGAVTGGPLADGRPTDKDTLGDAVMAGYSFQIDLNTSFTGEDSLDISLDAGNTTTSTLGILEFDGNATGDALNVDGVSYTFPLGDSMTAIIGDNTDGSALFTTACSYGGPTNTLDDCGNVNAGITNGGAMVGASYDFGTGFTAAVGYAAGESDMATGLMSKETLDAYGVNAAYTGDNFGVSITYGLVETSSIDEDTFTAFNGYYSPEGFPSISVGYEIGEDGSVTDKTADELTSFFVGLQFDELGPGSAGIALGTKTPTVEKTDEQYMYEAYYSYPINDGMTITPVVFIKETTTAGVDDETGVMVKTSFSF